MIGLLLFLDGPQQMDTSCPNSDLDGNSDVWDSWLRVVGYGSSEQNQNCNNLLNTLHKIGDLDLDKVTLWAGSNFELSQLFSVHRQPQPRDCDSPPSLSCVYRRANLLSISTVSQFSLFTGILSRETELWFPFLPLLLYRPVFTVFTQSSSSQLTAKAHLVNWSGNH